MYPVTLQLWAALNLSLFLLNLKIRNLFKFQKPLNNMDKIEIIDIEEDDSEDEEILDEDESEEEYEDESEEEKIENEKYEQHKTWIKQKSDRELMENISERLHLVERDIKHIQEDLVDVFNLILEIQGEE